MNDIKQEFIVTEHPPWYWKSDYKDAFNCENTQGLFDKVFNLMMCKLEELSERENRYKPKTIYKIIRSLVIQDADTIQQKPSRSLLLALMDLVDIDEGNGFESMAGVDRAGVKHLLLAYGDYTAFYIPNKELISTNGMKVIPVVTQYSENDNFAYYDISRSMIGTYYTKGNEKSIFVQEVLLVPGLKSLELLKSIMGNKFEFWDMTLEVPTHLTALTPSFQHIQPFQLLYTENKNPFTLSNADALVSPMDAIHPMCCVIDTASAEMLNKKREASVDCFTEKQLRCDLKHFQYTNGDSRIVYFRRNEFLDGKQVNLVPVVTLRKGQAEAPELYVSTTVRFCRAVTHCCVKGKGQPVSGWISTLKELKRETFITGTDMCQGIHNRALTAFIERVNPNSLYNDIPKHVESMIMDPIMVEVVELAIEFMGHKIPNAFAVAELLYCPIEKVQEYLKFWNMYSSDNTIHTAVRMKRIRMVEEQMRMDLDALSHTASSYVQKRYSEDGNSEMVPACEEVLKHQTLDNPAKICKMWNNMTKLRPIEITDPELVQTYSKAVVLYSKLCIREGVCGYPQSGSSSPHSTEAQDADVEEHSKDETMTEDDSLYSIVTPESIPILTWLKNMSTLLLSEPWLHDDDVRREAVCTLLGLDDTLLDRRCSDDLRKWVIDNRAVVKLLQTYGLQDRLSKALVDCLESTSTNKWRHNVLLSLQGTRDQLRGYSDPEMSNKINPSAQSNKGDMRSKGVGKCAKKHAPFQHPKAVKQDRLDSKSNKSSPSKSSGSKSHKKASDSRAHSSHHRYSHNHEHPWLREAKKLNSEEEEEDLEATMYSEDNESPDKYDYSDNYSDDLIDGRHTEEKYSSGKEGNEAFCAHVKKSAKKATCKTKNVNQRRKYKRVPHSDSEEDEYSPEPACSGMKEEIRGYKRPLKSDSEEELIKPDVKRVKRIKENCHPDKSEKKRSRNAKVVKEPVQRYDRGDKTCAKMKQRKSDKRCGRVKLTKNKLTLNWGFPLYKSKSSDSETEDYKWKGKRVGGKKKVNSSKNSEQEERRLHKKTQKGGPDNTPREKLQKTEVGRSLVPQDALKKQDLSNHPSATWSNHSPGVSQSQGRRSSGEAAKVAKLTDQAAWPKDTLQHESSDHEGERERDREEEGLSEEDSDVESDFNDRLNRHENTGCSDHEADYSEDEYLVIM